MSHKAGQEFFREKRPWSKHKDQILADYLPPYLPKVATQKRPILVVDGFAGPGKFGDGEAGSPIIIAEAVKQFQTTAKVDAKCLFIESDTDLHTNLTKNIEQYSFIETRNKPFLECIPEILSLSKTHSVFLYLDPFTIKGLEWEPINQVLDNLKYGRSVELLLNFNVGSFVRWGLSALGKAQTVLNIGTDDEDIELPISASLQPLSQVIGGEWWIPLLNDCDSYEAQINAVTSRYCEQMRSRFNEVCNYPIEEHWKYKAPKYILLFGSRHPDAILLMNDRMRKSRDLFAEQTAPKEPMLFDDTPTRIIPEAGRLPGLILELAEYKMSRKALLTRVVRKHTGDFSCSEINKTISQLIDDSRLVSATGKSRINDEVEVWKP